MAPGYGLGMDDAAKRCAGRAAADLVESGMRVGLGTGSTFRHALERLAERVREEGLEISGVPSSVSTRTLAEDHGITLLDLEQVDTLDLTIDGADEVDPGKNLIKGGGGALMRERIIAGAAKELVVIVSEDKLVDPLGSTFPLPVEVLPFGWRQALREIVSFGCEPELRLRAGEPYLTDNDNFILDCRFAAIEDPAALYRELNCIPGVLDNGLFVGMAGRVFVGNAHGMVRVLQ